MSKGYIPPEFLDRPIAFHPAFVRLGVGVTGAVMLGQAVYWSSRTKDSSGWFYKTQSEWESETALTRYEQEGARKKLKKLGILQEMKRGVPCKVFYRVDFQQLSLLLFQYVENQQTSMQETSSTGCGNSPNSDAENQQTITESTHRVPETTTESTKATPAAKPKKSSSGAGARKGKKTTQDQYTLKGMDLSGWPSEPSEQVLQDWLAVRRAKKAIITQTVVNRIGAQLTEAAKAGFSVDQCFSIAIERNWQGFEAAWIIKALGGTSGQGQQKQGYFRNDNYAEKDYRKGMDDDGRF